MREKQNRITVDQAIAQGMMAHDAYMELAPQIKEFMLGRELDRAQGAVVLGMVITTFYEGEDLANFINTVEAMERFRGDWRGRKK